MSIWSPARGDVNPIPGPRYSAKCQSNPHHLMIRFNPRHTNVLSMSFWYRECCAGSTNLAWRHSETLPPVQCQSIPNFIHFVISDIPRDKKKLSLVQANTTRTAILGTRVLIGHKTAGKFRKFDLKIISFLKLWQAISRLILDVERSFQQKQNWS